MDEIKYNGKQYTKENLPFVYPAYTFQKPKLKDIDIGSKFMTHLKNDYSCSSIVIKRISKTEFKFEYDVIFMYPRVGFDGNNMTYTCMVQNE